MVLGCDVLPSTVKTVSIKWVCDGIYILPISYCDHSVVLVQGLLGLRLRDQSTTDVDVVLAHLVMCCTGRHQHLVVLKDLSRRSTSLSHSQRRTHV